MRRVLAVVLAGGPVLVATSCTDPTQIAVDVRTDFPCDPAMDTTVTAGSATARKTGCEGAMHVGRVVLVPSGNGDKVSLRVDATGPLGTVEARRSISYLKHTRLELPVTLYTACIGQRCPDPSTTCVAVNGIATCVPAEIDPSTCTPPRICEPTLDGGTPPVDVDGGANADGGVDAGKDASPDGGFAPTCPAVATNGTLQERWSFDMKNLFGDLKGSYGDAPLQCATFKPSTLQGCGSFLDLTGCMPTEQQPIGTNYVPPITLPDFNVTLIFRRVVTGIIVQHENQSGRGWVLRLDSPTQITLSLDGSVASQPLTLPLAQVAGWHQVQLGCKTALCTFTVDGVQTGAAQPPGSSPSGSPLVASGTELEELSYFTVP